MCKIIGNEHLMPYTEEVLRLGMQGRETNISWRELEYQRKVLM